MRTNIVLDDALVDEAFSYAKATTKRELIATALREYVQNHRQKDLLELFGDGGIAEDYNYKVLRRNRKT